MKLSDWMSGQAPGVPEPQKNVVNALMSVLGHQQPRGLDDLVDKFVSHGLGEVINSWISTEENLPVTAAQISQVFGVDIIAEVARRAGVATDNAAFSIALILPHMVDSLTPSGRIPPGSVSFTSLTPLDDL